MANMFAQADAFAVGESNSALEQNFEGDRPSFVVLFKNEVNPYNLGLLMGIYEN